MMLVSEFQTVSPYVCSYFFSLDWVAEWSSLSGKRCSLGWPYVLFVFCLFVILVISRFSFEDWIWVLIASVTGLCILFTIIKYL